MFSGNFAEMTTSTPFRDLLDAANLRHGTNGFTSSPKEGVLRIFSPCLYCLFYHSYRKSTLNNLHKLQTKVIQVDNYQLPPGNNYYLRYDFSMFYQLLRLHSGNFKMYANGKGK